MAIVRDIRIFSAPEGEFNNRSKWIELNLSDHSKRRMIKKINFLNRMPKDKQLAFIKYKHSEREK